MLRGLSLKPIVIRWIDTWLGTPGCFLLSCVRTLRRALFSEPRPRRAPKRILFLKLVEQGATVLAYGAVLRAIHMVGRDNVFFCVFETNRPILEILDVVPPDNLISVRAHRFAFLLMDAMRALLRIRRLGIDAIIDMEFFSRASAVFSYLTGASRRVGYHSFCSDTPYRGDLMTHRIQYSPYVHSATAFQLLVRALEFDSDDVPLPKIPLRVEETPIPRFTATEEEETRVSRLLLQSASRTLNKRLVILNPNAGDMLPIRRWPMERFVGLGRRILANHSDVAVIITGSPTELQTGTQVACGIESTQAVCVAGKTSLRDLLVLYALADVLVTNDSGPAHFASMTDTHAIVLFGPETPELFRPLGTRTHIISHRFACSPCISAFNHRLSPCREAICMQSISVDEVYEQVRTCLSSSRHLHREQNSDPPTAIPVSAHER